MVEIVDYSYDNQYEQAVYWKIEMYRQWTEEEQLKQELEQ